MKSIWRFVLLVFALSTMFVYTCIAEIPNLEGNWTGFQKGFYKERGYVGLTESSVINLTITEQKDRLFTGYITYKLVNGTERDEGFAGAICLDNETFYIAEFGKGYDLGSIISDDEIELIYFEGGEMAVVAIDRFYRTNYFEMNTPQLAAIGMVK